MPAGLGWRLALAAIMVLISVVAGRIIPLFTRNWLAKRDVSDLPETRGTVDRVALFTLHTGMIAWVFFPTFQPVGAVLLSAATLNLWRLMRWRGIATWAEPLVTILHVGYFWLVIGSAAGRVDADRPDAGGCRNPRVTAGAIGTMVLAVMTRVSLGHSGRALRADRITVLIYLLVVVAAAVRVVAAINGSFLPLI